MTLYTPPIYPQLHLATHFYMRPGDDTRSVLLFGGPELVTVSTLDQNWFPEGIEMLVLSACSTALSANGSKASENGQGEVEKLAKNADGAEVDSFAGSLIVEKHINTVIATLWNIQDQATAGFMQDFYRYLAKSKDYTRAGALRQAQLNLLHNKVDIPDARRKSLQKTYGIADYSHPVFWAPFILMGQWR